MKGIVKAAIALTAVCAVSAAAIVATSGLNKKTIYTDYNINECVKVTQLVTYKKLTKYDVNFDTDKNRAVQYIAYEECKNAIMNTPIESIDSIKFIREEGKYIKPMKPSDEDIEYVRARVPAIASLASTVGGLMADKNKTEVMIVVDKVKNSF